MSALMLSIDEVVEAIGVPFDEWAHQCHGISIAIVKSGLLPASRVARGSCAGVGGQHSWVVCSTDPGACYDRSVPLIDPTLWSYRDDVDGIWYGSLRNDWHHPHGQGSIWTWGKAGRPEGPPISPAGAVWSGDAETFLDMFSDGGGLDDRAWRMLASHAPVEGWPASEIFAAMSADPQFAVMLPVDRVGMLTYLNPGGLYLAGPEPT